MAPKGYSAEVRNILINIKAFFGKEKAEGCISVGNIMTRMEMATGINTSTIYNVIKNNNKPGKHQSSRRIVIDDFDRLVIIRKIHNFYRRKEFPTLDKLLAVLREDINFRGGRSTLWRFLKSLGFKFKKHDGRKFLIEKPEVVMLRHKYLRKIKHISEQTPASSIIYMDETWINASHTLKKCWVDAEGKGGIAAPLGKGQRLIIVHAGGNQGFVPEAKLSFVSKKTGDYHDEMNGKHFQEWLENKVFPNVPPKSTIIMDNASYHSVRCEKVPTSNNKKGEMQEWLKCQNVPFCDKLMKTELYELIKIHKPLSPKYYIDELAKTYGHEILRLPPYHCDLNPTELIWSQIKNYVATNNKDFNIKSIQMLFDEALHKVTDIDWKNAIRHVVDIEQSYWQKDHIVDIEIDQILITLAEESDDSSDSGTASED